MNNMTITKQQIFDRAVEHLRQQRAQSIDPKTSVCLYRGPDGLKCAIGALIPDELYQPEMEGLLADEIVKRYPTLASLFSPDSPSLLNSLQHMHDFWRLSDWEEGFAEIATEYRLSFKAKRGQQTPVGTA
jgi:hypothetical protein